MKRLLHLVAVLTVSGVFCGCGHTGAVRFYSLRDAVGESPAAGVPRAVPPPLILDPVRVADYLRRPQLVQRLGPHQMQYLEYDRWVGPLEQEIDDVLLEALATRLEGSRTVVREAGRDAGCRTPVRSARGRSSAAGPRSRGAGSCRRARLENVCRPRGRESGKVRTARWCSWRCHATAPPESGCGSRLPRCHPDWGRSGRSRRGRNRCARSACRGSRWSRGQVAAR